MVLGSRWGGRHQGMMAQGAAREELCEMLFMVHQEPKHLLLGPQPMPHGSVFLIPWILTSWPIRTIFPFFLINRTPV